MQTYQEQYQLTSLPSYAWRIVLDSTTGQLLECDTTDEWYKEHFMHTVQAFMGMVESSPIYVDADWNKPCQPISIPDFAHDMDAAWTERTDIKIMGKIYTYNTGSRIYSVGMAYCD